MVQWPQYRNFRRQGRPDISESCRPPLYASRIADKDPEDLEDRWVAMSPEFHHESKSDLVILIRDWVGRPPHTLVADKEFPILPIFSRPDSSSDMGRK